MSTDPSETCCSPVPEPPPLIVIEASGFSAVKSSVLLPSFSETFVLNDMVLGIYQKLAMPFNDKININGLEIGVNWIYNVLSDVQISCNALFYFDLADTKMNNNEITLKTLLSF